MNHRCVNQPVGGKCYDDDNQCAGSGWDDQNQIRVERGALKLKMKLKLNSADLEEAYCDKNVCRAANKEDAQSCEKDSECKSGSCEGKRDRVFFFPVFTYEREGTAVCCQPSNCPDIWTDEHADESPFNGLPAK